jgi:hypothetical protein
MSTPTEIIKFLQNYNAWRRGDETLEMPHPAEIGANIQDAVVILREYEKLTRRAKRAEVEVKRLKRDYEYDHKCLCEVRDRCELWKQRAERAEAELAAERARLDWVFHNCKVTADDFTTGNRDVYAIHDREDLGAAMKEGAKL